MSVSPDWRVSFFCLAKRKKPKKKLPPAASSSILSKSWAAVGNSLCSNSRLPNTLNIYSKSRPVSSGWEWAPKIFLVQKRSHQDCPLLLRWVAQTWWEISASGCLSPIDFIGRVSDCRPLRRATQEKAVGGVLFFGYFLMDKHKKVTRLEAKHKLTTENECNVKIASNHTRTTT